MAWYRNYYHCEDCGAAWTDEWSCCCDDECPQCGSRHWSPLKSDDLTEVVRREDGAFVVMRSPDSAEHRPNYVPLARFTSEEGARRFVVDGELI